MDQLIFASLSHIHYRYEVGMLKVPACITMIDRLLKVTTVGGSTFALSRSDGRAEVALGALAEDAVRFLALRGVARDHLLISAITRKGENNKESR